MNTLISVIVTTYNWPAALKACLDSLLIQSDLNFEILIADDGSTSETKNLIDSYLLRTTHINIRHIYHDDRGFRAGTIRNKSAAAAHGDYLIFLDGDCVVLPSFIKRHRNLAERGYFVPGNRVLLFQSYTDVVLSQSICLHSKGLLFFLWHWLKRDLNRILPFVLLPWNFHRYRNPKRWDKAMTCNLAVWKDDFLTVNGFDQLFEGWGFEDSDLIIRLIHTRIWRKEGRFAVPVLHLWHKQNDRSKHDENYQRLMERVNDPSFVRATEGVDVYLNTGTRPD